MRSFLIWLDVYVHQQQMNTNHPTFHPSFLFLLEKVQISSSGYNWTDTDLLHLWYIQHFLPLIVAVQLNRWRDLTYAKFGIGTEIQTLWRCWLLDVELVLPINNEQQRFISWDGSHAILANIWRTSTKTVFTKVLTDVLLHNQLFSVYIIINTNFEWQVSWKVS